MKIRSGSLNNKFLSASKVLCLILALILSLSFSLVSCKKDGDGDQSTTNGTSAADTSEATTEGETTPSKPEKLHPVVHKLNSTTPGIRILGVRNLESDNCINLDWSCSGIEFKINLDGGSLRFSATSVNPCFFKVLVDGEVVMRNPKTPYFTVDGDTSIVIKDIEPGEHVITVMKVTGHTLSRASVESVQFSGSIVEEEIAPKKHYIEFVGDSIGCAWGTIGNLEGAYTDQDGTLAYPYLLAKEFDADYSMTALSGQGLLVGSPGIAKGYLYSSPLRDSSATYKFERKADLVVINVGTNDFSQKAAKGITPEAFEKAYVEFLKTVREKNGSACRILCLYNSMNDTFGAQIVNACKTFGGEGAGVYCKELARVSGHPTIAEHEQYAKDLKDLVAELLKPFESNIEMKETGDGDLDIFDFSKKKK